MDLSDGIDSLPLRGGHGCWVAIIFHLFIILVLAGAMVVSGDASKKIQVLDPETFDLESPSRTIKQLLPSRHSP